MARGRKRRTYGVTNASGYPAIREVSSRAKARKIARDRNQRPGRSKWKAEPDDRINARTRGGNTTRETTRILKARRARRNARRRKR